MRLSRVPKDDVTRVQVRVHPFAAAFLEPFDVFGLEAEVVSSGALLWGEA